MKIKNLTEIIIHGIFLCLGLVTVASVALITVYLVVSGIPAITKIGLGDFLFGTEQRSRSSAYCRSYSRACTAPQVRYSSECRSAL